MTANASRRQTCKAIDEELQVVLAAFAAKHGLALNPSTGGSYSTGPAESYKFRVEFVSAADVTESGITLTEAKKIVRGLMQADPLAYPKGADEVLLEAVMAGRLFKFGHTVFGPIIGWNSRAPKSPLQFLGVSKNGEPCKAVGYKTRDHRADSIGLPASFSPVLDVQIGDPCFIDYEGSDEEGDEQGYYAAIIKSLDEKGAEVKYDNGVKEHVAFDRLIVRPRFI